MNAISSALTWVAIAVIALVAFPAVALVRLVTLFDPGRYAAGRTFRVLGSWTARINPAWKITTTGAVPPDMRRPYVVVANHQSAADIPLISTLPWEMKWVAKRELLRVPVLGWTMQLAGDIAVDRTDPDSRASVLRRARRVLEHRVSVMFFAEGTRSRDGRVKRFNDGAFRLAVEAGVPVLPIAVDGTSHALPSDGWTFNGADVRLHVLPPVETAGLTLADVPALRERVRADIVAQIAAWRGVPPEAVDALADVPARAPAA